MSVAAVCALRRSDGRSKYAVQQGEMMQQQQQPSVIRSISRVQPQQPAQQMPPKAREERRRCRLIKEMFGVLITVIVPGGAVLTRSGHTVTTPLCAT
ncbi:hypothetical protein KCP69_24105 [Salmonella enterica subsp. enterica]|nr:hypothetical protein KCP69_24105 [Salmonella enterica subsp. enterica]